MKIGVDLDGPVYPFAECLWAWCVKNGIKYGPQPTTQSWNFFTEEGWGESLEWYLETCGTAAEAGHLFASQEPHPGAVETLHKLREDGHTLHIMTFRTFPGAVRNTDGWLAKHNVPFDSLSFTKDKTIVPVDIMIEDNVDNARALQKAGTLAVIVDRNWNQEWLGARVGDRNGPRENDWKEFYEFVRNVSDYEEELLQAVPV